MAITKDMTMRNRITLADVLREANACKRCKGRKKIDSMVGTKENCPECWGTGIRQKEVEDGHKLFKEAADFESDKLKNLQKNKDGKSDLILKELKGVLEPKKPTYPGMNTRPSLMELNIVEIVEDENFKNAIDVTPVEYKVVKRAGRPKKVVE